MVFWPYAVCYGLLIPCFLLYLYTRQHVFLRYSRSPLELMGDAHNKDRLTVGLQELEGLSGVGIDGGLPCLAIDHH